MDSLKKFSIDDIELFRDDEDVDFAHVKIYALSDHSNSHKNPISLEVLKRDAHTILGKLIIGKFDKFTKDTTTHVPEQTILGYIIKDQEIEFKEKDGKTFIVVEGVISKLYATDIVQMFKDVNFRSVSCEFSCIEGEEDEFGNKPILSFCIHGVTILGLSYSPSCKGAEIKVMQFAEKENSKLQSFADERKKLFKKETNKEEEMADKEKKVAAEEKEKEMAKVEEKEKEMEAKEDSETKEMAETEKEKEDKPDSDKEKDTEKKMSEEEDDDKDDDENDDDEVEEKEKKMSTDANVDTAASLAFLENETETYKEMINKMYAQDKEIIMEEYLKMAKERDELKAYQEKKMSEEKEFEVNRIMAEVKEDLEDKEFEDLKQEGMSCKYEEVKGFANKVKAFAYEKSKSKQKKEKDDSIMKFAVEVKEEQKISTADDIYNKYL